MTLSVCETDYPLLCYATALCERLTAAGAEDVYKRQVAKNAQQKFEDEGADE